uniref:Co-chaperonin GroES n=1 Tax=uncultured virus TaxID=340016 RepID=A0A221S2P9_9VIRU|nr:co-chaperonin GroES [uncultured virus]
MNGRPPVRYGLVVRPETVEKKKGSIFLPDEVVDKHQWRQSQAVLVAMGDLAFTMGTPGNAGYFEDRDAPKVGDTVFFREYNGQQVAEKDGVRYLILQDSEILGVKLND